jgi:Mg2+/Co2+ transporter CorB
MVSHTAPTLVAVVVLLGCSAFFSSSETALFSLSREWLAEVAPTDTRAAAVSEVLDDPHRLLVTILVGNNVVNLAISSLVTALLVERLQSSTAVLVATAVTSSLILVCGEIVPKSYGLGNAKTFSLRVVGPLRYVELLMYPAVALFDTLTREITKRIGGHPAIETQFVDDEDAPIDP